MAVRGPLARGPSWPIWSPYGPPKSLRPRSKIAPTAMSNQTFVRTGRGRLTKTNDPYWPLTKQAFFPSFPFLENDQLQEKRESRPNHAKTGSILGVAHKSIL